MATESVMDNDRPQRVLDDSDKVVLENVRSLCARILKKSEMKKMRPLPYRIHAMLADIVLDLEEVWEDSEIQFPINRPHSPYICFVKKIQ